MGPVYPGLGQRAAQYGQTKGRQGGPAGDPEPCAQGVPCESHCRSSGLQASGSLCLGGDVGLKEHLAVAEGPRWGQPMVSEDSGSHLSLPSLQPRVLG